ncbi:MAG TPA: hypothetical protein VM680_18530 [Verrucomicrobiae bacterium]|nr:hypothetical protein [Verrucomicrobiae bacterium]
MSDPAKNMPMPASFGQFKTLFVTAGLKTAMLVTSVNGRMGQRRKNFADPHAALSWCESHGAMMVFTPVAGTN